MTGGDGGGGVESSSSGGGGGAGNGGGGGGGTLPRVKPFLRTYEKEIVLYAYFKRLDYFSTECVYAPFAARRVRGAACPPCQQQQRLSSHAPRRCTCSLPGCRPRPLPELQSKSLMRMMHRRGFAREFVKDLEAARPSAIADIVRSAEALRFAAPGGGGAGPDGGAGKAAPPPRSCERCGFMASQAVCKACVLLDGLNRGMPRLGVSRTRGAAGRRAGLPAEIELRYEEEPRPGGGGRGRGRGGGAAVAAAAPAPAAG